MSRMVDIICFKEPKVTVTTIPDYPVDGQVTKGWKVSIEDIEFWVHQSYPGGK